jgi:hypothetical protein
MTPVIKQRLLIPGAFFVFTSILWIVFRASPFSIIALLLGLLIGTFLLDTDVLVHHLLFHPDSEVSTQIRLLFDHKDYKGLASLLLSHHLREDNYIFHHLQFILALLVISLFVFTTSASILGGSLVLAIHFHLFDDISTAFKADATRLQSWLFARMDKQLPLANLKQLLYGYGLVIIIFSLLFLRLGI